MATRSATERRQTHNRDVLPRSSDVLVGAVRIVRGRIWSVLRFLLAFAVPRLLRQHNYLLVCRRSSNVDRWHSIRALRNALRRYEVRVSNRICDVRHDVARSCVGRRSVFGLSSDFALNSRAKPRNSLFKLGRGSGARRSSFRICFGVHGRLVARSAQQEFTGRAQSFSSVDREK